MLHSRALLSSLVCCAAVAAQDTGYSFVQAQSLFGKYCRSCHQPKNAAGGFDVSQVVTEASLTEHASRWKSLATRVFNGEMPPKGSPAPGLDEREQLAVWVDAELRSRLCTTAPASGPALIRRLNRDEYSATIRDLLDIHMDIASSLPGDGAGGEGFDNAAETLFLSPLHSEKYLDLAKFALEFAAKEYKSRAKIFVAEPGHGKTEAQAAREILTSFLSRAFRRPAGDTTIAPYLDLFRAARKQRQTFEASILYALRGALVSPNFLFRLEQPFDDYALASRLSYFLWGSMPDEFLFDVAATGKLREPEVLTHVVRRMLRNDRSLDFAKRFVEQWLRTRELDTDKAPDAKLFPEYASNEELRSDIRVQPVLFFRELMLRDMSLLELIDSKYTIGTSNLSKYLEVNLPIRTNARKQPQWVELPEGTNRGGLLGMPAVLAVSSYPYRTSPVLRGAWVLDAILGTPPPPPPPDVPPLDETHDGVAAKSVRERLEKHKKEAACASCHTRIDPIGFPLENYDPIGRWRTKDGDTAIDSTSEFPDGTRVQGPAELKAVIMKRKDLFIRNVTSKLLGYALGRGLTLQDSCTVDAIVSKIRDNNYSALALVNAIVFSEPFQRGDVKGTRRP
jgi:mono/diheme cytochrome c family protein